MPDEAETEVDQWYAKTGEQVHGPLAFDELVDMAESGQLSPEDRVWWQSPANWRPAKELAGLSGILLGRIVRAAPPAPAGSWVGRHWRGELPLAASYWVNGLLVNFVFTAAVVSLGRVIAPLRNLLLPFAALSSAWVLAAVIAIWQVVGVWRAAGHAMLANGRYFWPIVARMLMVLTVARGVSSLAELGWPQLWDAWQAATGDRQEGPRGVRILNGGTEIEISGFLARGLEAQLQAALAQAPNTKIVHLDSPGGRVAEAQTLAGLIQAAKLDTLVEKRCESACTAVLLAGQHRWMRPGAQIGFHAGTFGGTDLAEASDGLRAAYRAAGLPDSFIARALGTPSDAMWRLQQSELLAAHVVTDIAADDQFGRGGFGPSPAGDAAARQLAATPLLAALKTADPAGWGAIEAAYRAMILKGTPETEFRETVRQHVQQLAPRLRSTAPDPVILAFGKLRTAELTALQAKDPEACWTFQTSGQIGLKLYLSDDLQRQDEAFAARLVTEAVASPAPPTTAEAGQRLVRDALAQVKAAGQDPQAIARAFAPGAPHSALCPALIALFDAASQLPPADGAALLRFLTGAH